MKAIESVADKNIVDAWTSCKNSKHGVMINGELKGDDVIITYVFRAAGSISQAVIDGEPYISGATCNTTLKHGMVIDTGGLVQVCKRNSDFPIAVAIYTNFQPARFFIPVPKGPIQAALKALDKPVSIQEFCKTWKGSEIPRTCLGKRESP